MSVDAIVTELMLALESVFEFHVFKSFATYFALSLFFGYFGLDKILIALLLFKGR